MNARTTLAQREATVPTSLDPISAPVVLVSVVTHKLDVLILMSALRFLTSAILTPSAPTPLETIDVNAYLVILAMA